MREPSDHTPPRLGRLELLGAWLRIWTPPRDAVVPPVPWRAVGVLAVLVTALAAAATIVLQQAAEHRRAGEQRADAARHAAFLASVDREQRAFSGDGAHDPGATASREKRVAARAELVAAARTRIRADAIARTRKRIRGVSCEPFPRTLGGVAPTEDLARPAAAYDCTAVTGRFGGGATGVAGIIGIPFRLIARFADGTFAWCRIVPLPDEDRLSHPLPRPCRLP